MDVRFHAAQAAILADDAWELERLVRADPSLASDRSSAANDHPTLLCCLVLAMPARRELDRLIRLFGESGAGFGEALVSAASINNLVAVESLLNLGAPIAGKGIWSPLEEALYWGHGATVELLIARGAPVDNIRKQAALGDLAGLTAWFDADGRLNARAGEVAWPFRDPIPDGVRRDPRQIINNALVFAAAWGQVDSASELLRRGADINSIPAGFDFAGTPLHYAALNNRREMADWLLGQGADPAIRDPKVQNTPDGWAAHANHTELAGHLRRIREGR